MVREKRAGPVGIAGATELEDLAVLAVGAGAAIRQAQL